jgi:hypothetical protein
MRALTRGPSDHVSPHDKLARHRAEAARQVIDSRIVHLPARNHGPEHSLHAMRHADDPM